MPTGKLLASAHGIENIRVRSAVRNGARAADYPALMAIVLCISTDEALAVTRRMILEKAGHRVVTVFTIPEIERACGTEPVEVAIIGQGVPGRERQRIRDVLRSDCPTAKVLELYLPWVGRLLPDADDWLEVPSDEPAELGEKVSALALGRRKATN